MGGVLRPLGDAKGYGPSTFYTCDPSLFFSIWDYVRLLQVTWQPEMNQMKQL